ncbi:MAG: ATP-binding domain-containing protein [Actinomycetota bacterium]
MSDQGGSDQDGGDPPEDITEGRLDSDRMADSASDRLADSTEDIVDRASAVRARRVGGPDRTVRAEDNNQPILDFEGLPFQELEVERPDDVAQRSATVRQLAVDEQVWRFGHVIVDEAQDLTPMQWRMVVRRSRQGSVTMLGDLAQRSIGEPGTWDDHLPPELSLFEQQNLTTNYRSPAEINDLAGTLLEDLAPELPKSRAVRRSGHEPAVVPVASLADELAAAVAAAPGVPAVLGFDLPNLSSLVANGRCRTFSPWQAKGLEFDSVVVVEPARFLDEPNGLSLLYVALTRSTDRLTIVHQRPLPDVLR